MTGLRLFFIAGVSALASALLMGATQDQSRISSQSQNTQPDAVRGGSTLQEETNAGPGDSDTIFGKDVGAQSSSSTSAGTSAGVSAGQVSQPASSSSSATTTTTESATEPAAEPAATATPRPEHGHKRGHGHRKKAKKPKAGAAVHRDSSQQMASREMSDSANALSEQELQSSEEVSTAESNQVSSQTAPMDQTNQTGQAEQTDQSSLLEARRNARARHKALTRSMASAPSLTMDLRSSEPNALYEPNSQQPDHAGSTEVTGKDKSLAALERNDTPFVDSAAKVRATMSRNATRPLSEVNFDDYTYSRRGQFESDMNSRLEKISAELDTLRAKVKASTEITRADALREIDHLESEQARVAGALNRVNGIADDRWGDFKSDFRSQISSLESSYQSLNASIR